MTDVFLSVTDATPKAVALRFDELGILIVTGFCDHGTAAAAATELERVVGSEPDKPPTFWEQGYPEHRHTSVQSWAVSAVAEQMPTCVTLLADARLDAWAEAICGPGFHQSDAYIYSTRRGHGQAWHQDSRDPAPDHFLLNRIMFVTELIEEQGRLRVVPGSHRLGDIPAGEPFGHLEGEVAVVPPPGSVVLMHSRCFHQVEPNRTDKPRAQYNSKTTPAACPAGISSYPMFSTGPWSFAAGRAE